MKTKLVLQLVVLTIVFSFSSSESTGVGEWHILTKQNFSSHIRLHPHILFLLTVSWCGESRSLMNQVSHILTDRKNEKFRSLKLAVLYRNSEKLLADSIGASDGITVLFYHHSVSYKYRGKLNAVNIMHSIYPYMSVSPEEVPFKSLHSVVEVKAFLESTDKAVILFDFCGWTRKLRASANSNATSQGNHFGLFFSEETDGTQISRENGNEKVIENGNFKCGIGNGFGGIPWLGEFSSVNDSTPFQETQNMMSGTGLSCNFEEFKLFESFFSKLMTAAREFFLPPERHRFGLVSEKSLLQYFGIDDSDSWSAFLHLAGCPSCSKILKDGNDLKGMLQMNNEVVGELDGDEKDLDTVLSANKPSIVLFVDRSSGSSETKSKGKEALDTFRELALHYLIPYRLSWQKSDQPMTPSVQSNQALRRTFEHPRLRLSPTAQKIKLKDKMSIMVINEGQHVVLDNNLQGSSLHEILAYFLQKKKEAKLSHLAKEVGFNLLSEDIDIKIVDASPSQTGVHSDSVSSIPPEEGLVKNIIDPDKDQSDGAGIAIEADSKSTFVLPSHHKEEETAVSVETNEQLMSEVPEHLPDHYLTSAEDVKVGEKSTSQEYKFGEPKIQFQGFSGSFFFSDGNNWLLRALTGGSTIPSLVIVDPISQQHYVFPKETIFSYSSMAGFLHGFLNRSLIPYQSSESILESSREATHPPFVNMDFHEVDSIPRVTTHTFSKLVLGLNKSDNENAWNEDVLVLFSSGWCGFCQRMELVVREVYRAIKGYLKMLKIECKNRETDPCGDNLKNVVSRFPRIYLMDCTLNDCSLILKPMIQRELFPALILFPAEGKNAVPYDGDIAVADVVKFMADHGNNSRHLISGKGILSTSTDKGAKHRDMFEGLSPTIDHDGILVKERFHEVLLNSRTPQRAKTGSWTKSHSSKRMHETARHVVVGSVLIASDKLVAVHPFENSKILIVKVDQGIGFEGLIYNKPIRWEALRELEEGLEFLKQAPLSFGGPLVKKEMPLVGLTRNFSKSQYLEVLPGVYFLDQLATVSEIEELKHGNHSISDYWFFVGYSRWDWNQLFDEIAGGAWTIGDDNMAHLDWPSSLV